MLAGNVQLKNLRNIKEFLKNYLFQKLNTRDSLMFLQHGNFLNEIESS